MCTGHYKSGAHLRVSLEKAAGDFYLEVHRIADSAEPLLRAKIVEALNGLAADASVAKLREAIFTNSFDRAVEALGITERELNRRMSGAIEVLRSAFDKTARKVLAENMPRSVQAQMSFDALNPYTVDAIRAIGAELVTNITDGTRASLKALIEDGFRDGIPPAQLAAKIKERIQLTAPHTRAVDNYLAMLLSEGVPPGTAKKRASAYAERLLRYRAKNIARTETIRAANAGQQALWDQAVSEGLVDPARTYKKWIVTKDDRLCPICRPIPGENTKVPVSGGSFVTSRGVVSHPPAHPHCRCAMGLSFGN